MSDNKPEKVGTKGCLGEDTIQLVFTGIYVASIAFLWTPLGPVKAVLVSALFILLVLALGCISGLVPILGQILYYHFYSILIFWFLELFGIDPHSQTTLVQFGRWGGIGVSIVASINFARFIHSNYRKAFQKNIDKKFISNQDEKSPLPLSHLISSKELKITAFTLWGVRLWNQGKVLEGRSYLEKAYELGKENPDPKFRKLPLFYLGTAYLYFRQPQSALSCFLEYLEGKEIVLRGLMRSPIAEAHWGAGTACMQLGQYQEALDHFLECVSFSREHNNYLSEVRGLKGLAIVYSELGQHDEAIACLQGSLKRLGMLRNKAELGDIQNVLGVVFWQKGSYKEALVAFTRALELLGRNNAHSITTLHNIGSLYTSMGRASDALLYLQQALALKVQLGGESQTATTHNSLGIILYEAGRCDEALAHFRQALSINLKIGDKSGEANSRQSIAAVLLRSGDSKGAETEIGKVIALAETARTELVSDELRTGSFIKPQEAYKIYIFALMSRFFQSKNYTDVIQAFNLNERRRSRALLDLVTDHAPAMPNRTTPEPAARVVDLRSQIMQIQQLLFLEPGEVSDLFEVWRRNKLQAERDRLEAELHLQLDTLQARKPRYPSIDHPDPITHDEILAELLDNNTALLEYILMDPFSCLWVITKQYQAVYKLFPKTILESKIRSFIQELNSPGPMDLSNAYLLYQMLIQTAEPIFAGKRLVIAADDILSYLPFGTLLTEAVTPKTSDSQTVGKYTELPYLIRRHPISYIPSASVLSELRRAKKGTPAVWCRDLIAVADPLLPGTNDESWQASQVPESILRGYLRELPGTRREVMAIASLFDASRYLVLMGPDASRKKILSAGLENCRYVHFAAHALITDDRPDLSGLLVSVDAGETCFLTPFDIVGLNLTADMIVLSACSTGKGKLVSGEGVFGLSRAFLAAGARTVVVSLWRVEDESTALLMKFFYDTLINSANSSHDKAQAMQQAQLQLIADPRWAHPHYWAPFVVIGDWC